jgi:N-dimethylarginine dimethylaminohydrolase
MQREKKDSKNKTKRLRGDTDTRLHQVIREKGFYNAQRKRVERAGERVSLKSNAVLSNKKRIFERARKRRFRKKLKKAGGKVEIIRFSVVCVEMSSNIK